MIKISAKIKQDKRPKERLQQENKRKNSITKILLRGKILVRYRVIMK